MIEDRDFGRLEARVERLEGLRQRLLDMLPLMAVLALLAGQWVFIATRFDVMDDRLDRLEAGQLRIEQKLGVTP